MEPTRVWVRGPLENDYHARDEQKQAELMKRMERHFAKSIKIAEKTMERLESLRVTDPPPPR